MVIVSKERRDIRYNVIQQNDTEHNAIRQNIIPVQLIAVIQCVIMLFVIVVMLLLLY